MGGRVQIPLVYERTALYLQAETDTSDKLHCAITHIEISYQSYNDD